MGRMIELPDDDFTLAPPEQRTYNIDDKPVSEPDFSAALLRIFAMTDEELRDLTEWHIERGRE